MNPSLERVLNRILTETCDQEPLACEGSIRVAASMLRTAAPCEVQTTTVIGTVGRDDRAAVRAVAEVAALEWDLDVVVTIKSSTFRIKFSRPTCVEP